AYLDFPTDVLRGPARDELNTVAGAERVPSPSTPADSALDSAATVIKNARRPLVISGRGLVRDPEPLEHFLEASGALYLDTPESRGLVAPDHPAYVPAARST